MDHSWEGRGGERKEDGVCTTPGTLGGRKGGNWFTPDPASSRCDYCLRSLRVGSLEGRGSSP